MSNIKTAPKQGSSLNYLGSSRGLTVQGPWGADSSPDAGGLLPRLQAWDVPLSFVDAF